MGRDALDKAKAYGSGRPGSDGAVVTPTTNSSTSAAGFLGGVRRTFSGSAVLPNSTRSAVSDPEKTTACNDNTAVAGEAGTAWAEALSTAIEGRLSSSKQGSVDVVSPLSPEPPTPTPSSIGFGSGTAAPSTRHSHVRNISIASIISEGNTVMPRPSTPSTESKNAHKSGPTPQHRGCVGISEPAKTRWYWGCNAAAKTGDTVTTSEAEPGASKVDEESATKEGVDIREADAKPTDEVQEMRNGEASEPILPTFDAPVAPSLSTERSMLPNEQSTTLEPTSEEPLFSATPESSAPAPLRVIEPPTPTSPSASPLPLFFDDANEDLEPSPVGHTWARQASVVSSSSAYFPSVYTTNSGVNEPAFPGGEQSTKRAFVMMKLPIFTWDANHGKRGRGYS
ncbi:hypothetical protein M408DRAFT_25134 [Serendipita vermifera MAFF 305830]|uniref:Uncharacterized protein n=1 Tax=Serendipita vermifera MAFF 305830 TaxID=933852 RepID=A0A0C3AQN3_SERVB|nr:hypothetical protein M408DRAFT_25134 [Serendipita vermifera MAFF 305830]